MFPDTLQEKGVFMNISPRIYFCGHEQCSSGHAFGPAVRPHYLIHFILKGKGRYQVNGHSFSLQTGDAFLILPGETTFYEADDDSPWEYAWIGFGGKDCRSLLSSCSFSDHGYIYHGGQSRQERENFDQIRSLLRNMLLSFESGSSDPFELLGWFYLILSKMSGSGAAAPDLPEELYLEKALDYIHNNYSYPIRIQQLAKQIGIDRSYLYKLMERRFHLSPQQYLIEYRLMKAREMLTDTSMSITEITFSCGFKDTPSFCRMFKKRTGLSPGMFRRNPSAFRLSES